jgi:hypothetical protein
MKKLIFGILTVAVIAVAVFGITGYVYAQGPNPQAPPPGNGNGRMGGGMHNPGTQDGPLHDGMVAAIAEKLGMGEEDLEARLTAGETMSTIATEKGFTADEFFTMMKDARTAAIDQAVTAGTLTQEQADWMKTRGFGQGGQGMRNGQGQFANPDCPYYDQTAQ